MIKNTDQCLHKTKAFFLLLVPAHLQVCWGYTKRLEWHDGMEKSELEGTHKNHQSSILGLAQDRHKKLGGETQSVQLPPTDQRNIPHDMEWHHLQHIRASWRRGKRGGDICLPKQPLVWWSPALQEMAEHLPADGWMNSLFCYACLHSFFFAYWMIF